LTGVRTDGKELVVQNVVFEVTALHYISKFNGRRCALS
jgi:hypothetical protein